MKFGARLLSSQHPPWSEHYIDYCRLKQLLHPLFNLEVRDTPRIGNGDQGNADGLDVELTPAGIDGVASSSNAGGSGGYMDPSYAINASLPLQAHGSTDEISSLLHQDGLAGTSHHDANHASQPAMTSSHDFQKELNYEIKKAVLFVLKSMGELASDLSELMKQQRSTSTNMKQLLDGNNDLIPETQIQPQNQEHELMVRQKLEEIYNLRMEYLVRIGSKLLLLLEFVELSIDAVIKIVKKHDKFLSKWEQQQPSSSLTRSITKSTISSEDQYVRLRRQYLPRFAMHSSDPNLRCLFLLAADAGDSGNNNGEQGHQALGSQLDGSFGGWNVMQYNLEVSLRELFNWEKGLQKVTSNVKVRTTSLGSIGCLKFDADNMKMADDNDVAIKEAPAYERTISWKALTRSISETHQTLVSRSTSFIGLAASAISPKKSQSKKEGEYAFFEPIIYRIKSSRRRLGQTTHRYGAMVYAHEMLHLIDDKNIHEEDEMLYLMQRRNSSVLGSMKELEKHHHQQDCTCDECKIKKWMEPLPTVSRLSKFLNLASSSLYMCNYNIVAPTSGLYAKLLGFNPANAGVIIGMTPVAVIGSSVLYSWATSYSYKRSLMFASFCCMAGNIVYALALPCDSLMMVLVGRLLTGFGSARVINRRYIADYYSIEDRTSGMADFVSASALGMAVGPGIAALLSAVAPDGQKDSDAWWTIETAPGYVMFVLWAVYLTCNIIFFEEPDRGESTTKNAPSKSSEQMEENSPIPSSSTGGTHPSENTPLIKPPHISISFDAPSQKKESRCNIPVLVSMLLLVLLKSVLESLTSSAPTVSGFYFGWGVHDSGIYLAGLASFMLPCSFAVAQISRKYDDRELILATLLMMLIGILGFLVYGGDEDSYSETRFILFGFVIFVSCNALEGPTMGLLSKTIPQSLAKGILNAGLLATEAGTIGRVIGDFWLSTAAYMGLDKVVNNTFLPLGVVVLVAILITVQAYSHLQPRYEDEDDDD